MPLMFKLLGVYLNISAWFMKNMSVIWKRKKIESHYYGACLKNANKFLHFLNISNRFLWVLFLHAIALQAI
jgi:hypothetical protein